MYFQAVVHKAEARIQAPRLLILPHHCELDEFDAAAGEIKCCLDQPAADPGSPRTGSNIHPPQQTFVRPLLALLNRKADDADQLAIEERAEHRCGAEPVKEPAQVVGIFSFERAPESLGVGAQRFQSNAAVKSGVACILLRQATDLDLSDTHVSFRPLQKSVSGNAANRAARKRET